MSAALLRLSMAQGAGPVRVGRLLHEFGSVDAVLGASASELATVQGIGPKIAEQISSGFAKTESLVEQELDLVNQAGVSLVAITDPGYPELLKQIPAPPPVIYIRGRLLESAYRVGIVGSRACSAYGIEQAERFGAQLASSGLSVVSGGARGIDTSAHHGALTMSPGKGCEPTIALLGCGLSNCYPPENKGLFDRIAGEGGAILSELPMLSEPEAKNFPARNRLISGLSLGIVVIEAGSKSGALITARLAAEEHGREVMALPGRVDSDASRGSLELLKMGGAHCVTDPSDVIGLLEHDARRQHMGTHDVLSTARSTSERAPMIPPSDPTQAAVLAALDSPQTAEALGISTGLDAGALRVAITLLEVSGRVGRHGLELHRN